MTFIHCQFHGGVDTVAIVTLDHQARVMLLDGPGLQDYRCGRSFFYHRGGWATRSPVHLSPPHWGCWHVVIDLNGGSGRVRADVQIHGQAG